MTGRNLHAEAGSGKGWEEVVSREKGSQVPSSLEQESLFWVFLKEVAQATGVGRSPGRAGAAAEMTIQSQDTAEDCTAASGELGRSAASAEAVQLAK